MRERERYPVEKERDRKIGVMWCEEVCSSRTHDEQASFFSLVRKKKKKSGKINKLKENA